MRGASSGEAPGQALLSPPFVLGSLIKGESSWWWSGICHEQDQVCPSPVPGSLCPTTFMCRDIPVDVCRGIWAPKGAGGCVAVPGWGSSPTVGWWLCSCTGTPQTPPPPHSHSQPFLVLGLPCDHPKPCGLLTFGTFLFLALNGSARSSAAGDPSRQHQDGQSAACSSGWQESRAVKHPVTASPAGAGCRRENTRQRLSQALPLPGDQGRPACSAALCP